MTIHHLTDNKQGMFRFIAFFLGLFFTLQLLSQGVRDTAPWHFMIDDLTVSPSTKLINWFTPEESVISQGHRLQSSYVRMSVLNGCEGTDVILLLTSALAAAGISLRRKLMGIILGGMLIYAANLLRIVSLYYCLRFDRTLFESVHGFVAPIVVIACAGVFFLYWITHAQPDAVH